eukprot:CAMPEP_0185004150 /NCGR_PEP_ID=MMETSP1098-20130426/78467_1 /TAXON_ID=89044 /ORGANISM="Spumella elongata, Strain CCAP 955/1" /LENGTH=221 /DNA_ID=CAMNT_0027531925 /DNA_START=96 /DNA_END=761 /DNA_ORIENTATION=+
MDIIVASPVMSALLQADEPTLVVPKPVLLADLTDPAAMAAHRTNAVEYFFQCKGRGVTLRGDINSAIVFQSGVVAAEVLSKIPILVAQTQIQDWAAQANIKIDKYEDDLRLLEYELHVCTSRSYNASASITAPQVRPPPHVITTPGQSIAQALAANVAAGRPAYPDPATQVPPPSTNLNDIFYLFENDLERTQVENYYSLEHEGSDVERRERIFTCYGIRF